MGQDVPALGLALDSSSTLIDRFSTALENENNVKNSLFRFENINGPLLMIPQNMIKFGLLFKWLKILKLI